MKLIINLDKIEDPTKKEWLINLLELMQIEFQTTGNPQTIVQYNKDLEKGSAEIERGEFVTATDLKTEVNKW